MARVDISIVIVSYNTQKLLVDCIESVISNTHNVSYEIIIVDNASNDSSVTAVKNLSKKHKKIGVHIIENSENMGFAYANNQGIEVAQGEYYLLLNSDTYFVRDALHTMFELMESRQDVGIASCALRNPDSTMQASGGYSLNLRRLFFWVFFIDDLPIISRFIDSYHPHINHFQSSHEQGWVTGAFFMIRAKVVNDIGKLDPDYFMYVEEMDFSYRAILKGWKVLYDPRTSIIHIGQGSGTSQNALTQELLNVHKFFTKHLPGQASIAKLLLKAGTAKRMILFAILGQKQKSYIYGEIFKKL